MPTMLRIVLALCLGQTSCPQMPHLISSRDTRVLLKYLDSVILAKFKGNAAD
jgi:hypothetical protein